MSYFDDAKSDAADTVREFREAIADQLIGNGKASADLFNDYHNGDSWHHESHVDREYDLQESAELLGELRQFKETDSGLWEGQEPEQAIATQAAYTYGAAVLSFWSDLIEEINDKWDETDASTHLDNLESATEGLKEILDLGIDIEETKKKLADKLIDSVLN